jgi:hypothetical protein
MTPQAISTPRFVRKTRLGPNEYRKNFHQIDREVMTAVTSEMADRVTPLMSKIYLRLVNAPERFWEREGVLRIEAEVKDEKLVKAWAVLCELVGVSSATASKALRWMHEQGIIGYFSGKNGVGLRIFLNRATSSIGVRTRRVGEKILTFPSGSSGDVYASPNEPAFNVPFGDLENSDTNNKSPAPKNGADAYPVGKTSPDRAEHSTPAQLPRVISNTVPARIATVVSLDDVIVRLRTELEPVMQAAARQAATREHERTREWLENRGLPKAARVAQHETYNVLRKYGVISETSRDPRAHSDVGRSCHAPLGPHPLSADEVSELAQACVAMLETHGQSVEVTLSEMGSETGGFLLPEDAGRVRDQANSLISVGDGRGGK